VRELNMVRIPFSRTIKNFIKIPLLKKELVKESWSFSSYRLKMILNETVEWEKYYLPIDIKGKIVLDVGAGEGETARFFFKSRC
jgi:hypothetical protein